MYVLSNTIGFPTKQPLPCLEYDLAYYSNVLLSKLPCALPEYLSQYEKLLKSNAQHMEELKPTEFPDAIRVYLFDYRLNPLFAALDPDGKIATGFSKFSRQSSIPEDYYYGNGEFIGGDMLPSAPYDTQSLSRFSGTYGFLPIEELSMSASAIFVGEHLDDLHPLSQFQTQVLMQRYRSKNLIDWKTIIKSLSHEFPSLR